MDVTLAEVVLCLRIVEVAGTWGEVCRVSLGCDGTVDWFGGEGGGVNLPCSLSDGLRTYLSIM